MKRLYRDPKDKIICGVCSGIGKYLGIDPVIIRLAAIALLIVNPGLAIILYLAACILIPEKIGEEISISEEKKIIPEGVEKNIVRAAKVLLIIVGIIMIAYGLALVAEPLFQPVFTSLTSLVTGLSAFEAIHRIISGLLLAFIGVVIIILAVRVTEEASKKHSET